MDQKRIINFEQGVLYIKLREDFAPRTMEIHCTLAEVSRSGVKVVKADSRGEVSSTSMSLTAQEFALLREAMELVDAWWEKDTLEHHHVLIGCGHILNWDEHQESLHCGTSYYEMPYLGKKTYCFECEREMEILRFNPDDFVE